MNGDKDVDRNADVSATFAKDLDESSVTGGRKFFVTLDDIPVMQVPTVNGNVATLMPPPGGWDLGVQYKAHLLPDIKATDNTTLVTSELTWVFEIRDGSFQVASPIPAAVTQFEFAAGLEAADDLDRWEAFFTDNNGKVEVAHLNATGSWQSPALQIVSTSALAAQETSVASTGDGVAIFSKISTQEVRISSTDAIGWKTAKQITGGSNGSGSLPQVATTVSNGFSRSHAVWVKKSSSDQVLYDATPDPDMADAVALISGDFPATGPPIFELDLGARADLVVAVYARDNPPTQVNLLAAYDSPLQSWTVSPPPVPTTLRTATSLSNLRLAMGGAGIILWIESGVVMTSNFDSTSDAPAFSGATSLNAGGASQGEIAVGEDYGFAIWVEGQAGNDRLIIRRFDINAAQPLWEQRLVLNPNLIGSVTKASVSLDRNDNALVVWQQSDSQSNLDIIFSCRLLAKETSHSGPVDVFSSLVNSIRMTGPQAALLADGRGVVVARDESDNNTLKYVLFE